MLLNHASIYQSYLRDGRWQAGSALFAMLGQLGVSLFFMITAYLFYGRLIAAAGRPDWLRLYIGRVFRIAPVYLVTISGLFAVVAAGSGFQIRVPAGRLAAETAAWLALGAGPRLDLNGYSDTSHLLAGVTWTLQSEWLFYASLPLLAPAARRQGPGGALLMPLLGLAVTLAILGVAAPAGFPACLGPFFAGMAAAASPKAGWAGTPFGSLLAAAILAAFFVTGLAPRGATGILLLGGCFHLLVSGCPVFGLLTCRLVRWLGSISYGVYLFHGLVLSRLFAIPGVHAFALVSPARHWLAVSGAIALVLALAHAAHLLVEEPGIRFGKQVGRRARRGVQAASDMPAVSV